MTAALRKQTKPHKLKAPSAAVVAQTAHCRSRLKAELSLKGLTTELEYPLAARSKGRYPRDSKCCPAITEPASPAHRGDIR